MRIRAYNATGELDISNTMTSTKHRNAFILGTRVLLTCNVTVPPQGGKLLNYQWYRNCTGHPDSRCEIRDGDPYYSVVNDTLLVDVIPWDYGVRYYCFLHYLQGAEATPLNSFTPIITVAG